MKCPECVVENKKSTIFIGGSTETSMSFQPYYDEEGVYHIHNPNLTTTNYTCSNGHAWVDSRKHPCPGACTYGTDK